MSKLEVKAYHHYSNARPDVVIHSREALGQEARLAIAFCERWGMVQAEDGSEDSAGRKTYKLMDVDSVVERAIGMAEQLMTQIRAKGWTVDVPTLAECETQISTEKLIG